MIYPIRYEAEPQKRKAYTEACDMIAVYGIPRNEWDYHKFGINRIDMKEIWNFATKDMEGKSMLCCIY